MSNVPGVGDFAAAGNITTWVRSAHAGDRTAADHLYQAIYHELRRIAHAQRARHDPQRSVTTTALVHELYLRLEKAGDLAVVDRHHLLSLAARVMRQILIDAARRDLADRRGGGVRVEALGEDFEIAAPERPRELIELDAALDRLREQDSDLARLVDLHFFGGLSLERIAELVGGSERTVRRQWRRARAFLHDQMRAVSP